MTLSAFTGCDPETTIALEICSDDIGPALAHMLADLGATVALYGQDSSALDRLRQAIALRWGRAVIGTAADSHDALIGVCPSIDAAIARLRTTGSSRTATEILLVRSVHAQDRSTLDLALAKLAPDQRAFAILLSDQTSKADMARIARICSALIAETGEGLANMQIALRSQPCPKGAGSSIYPTMPVCAPAIVPAL